MKGRVCGKYSSPGDPRRTHGPGDHVLWILGTLTPLPKKLIWQSDSVEAVLQQSQEVVPAWPAFGIGANPFTALRVWIEWRSIQKIPDRMALKEVLPPPLYARFSALKARYAPRDSRLDELRPAFAAERLWTRLSMPAGSRYTTKYNGPCSNSPASKA